MESSFLHPRAIDKLEHRKIVVCHSTDVICSLYTHNFIGYRTDELFVGICSNESHSDCNIRLNGIVSVELEVLLRKKVLQ